MASRARGPQRLHGERFVEAQSMEERVRQRAHEIYLQRGGEDGSEMDDWLQAEQEIRSSEPERRHS